MRPDESYRVILGLVEVCDWDSFSQVARAHPEDFPPEHMSAYQTFGDTFERLIADYDYTKSPEFLGQVAGHTAAYAATKYRLESAPVKRAKHRERFIEALAKYPKSTEVFDLLPVEHHDALHRLEIAFNSLPPGV